MLPPTLNEELQALLAVLPNNVRESLVQQQRFAELIEVVMDLGRQPTARYTDGEVVLNQNEITKMEIDAVVERIEAFIKLDRPDPVTYADETGIVHWTKAKSHVLEVLENYEN